MTIVGTTANIIITIMVMPTVLVLHTYRKTSVGRGNCYPESRHNGDPAEWNLRPEGGAADLTVVKQPRWEDHEKWDIEVS